jgi:hypothetical protein
MTKKQSSTRIKITKRALMQRINRKIAPDFEKLCTARSAAVQAQFGRCYIVETAREVGPMLLPGSGRVIHRSVDLEKLGRKLGLIQPWEELES